MSLEVFKGQIRVNEKRTYFGLDYELTDEVGNLIDKYNQLEKENQHLKENWSKLKDWLRSNDIHFADAIPFRETLRIMQELERSIMK